MTARGGEGNVRRQAVEGDAPGLIQEEAIVALAHADHRRHVLPICRCMASARPAGPWSKISVERAGETALDGVRLSKPAAAGGWPAAAASNQLVRVPTPLKIAKATGKSSNVLFFIRLAIVCLSVFAVPDRLAGLGCT